MCHIDSWGHRVPRVTTSVPQAPRGSADKSAVLCIPEALCTLQRRGYLCSAAQQQLAGGPHNPAPYTLGAQSGRRWLLLLGANGWDHEQLESITASTALLQRLLLSHSNTLATWCEELTHWKRPWCWERWKAGGEGDDRGWDGWMASPTPWTWVWVNSGSWW